MLAEIEPIFSADYDIQICLYQSNEDRKYMYNFWNMSILKIGPYLRNGCLQSEIKLKSALLGQKEGICATSGTLANGQVSFPNMAILKIGLYLRNGCPQSENNFNFYPSWPRVERQYMCNFWNFGQWPSFMPKYDSFENRLISRKRLPIEQK